MSPRPVANPYLRVSDVERQEVADLLKRHCADGRLDTAEFETRIDRTLRAKTRADLSGLLDDLPDLNPGRAPIHRPSGPDSTRHVAHAGGRSLVWAVVLVSVVLIAVFSTISAVTHATHHVVWPVLIIGGLLLWSRSHHRDRWHA